jgi:small subunit ribosomal protein S4e
VQEGNLLHQASDQGLAMSVIDAKNMCRIRYPDPAIKVNDTVKIDLSTGKISDFIKFDTGVIVMVTGGRNMGRVGVITHRERHDGGFNIVHLKDAVDNEFTTRETNVM